MTLPRESFADLTARASAARRSARGRRPVVREALKRADVVGFRHDACRLVIEACRWRSTIESGRMLPELSMRLSGRERPDHPEAVAAALAERHDTSPDEGIHVLHVGACRARADGGGGEHQ